MAGLGDEKTCVSCGRRITWRKKWARDWANVRYCGEACRRRKISSDDERFELAILGLLADRSPGATICPSDAARKVDPDGWVGRMEDARRAARRLVDRGVVEITQGGRAVDPSTARGPIRVRLVRQG
jgi:hypothetical protein